MERKKNKGRLLISCLLLVLMCTALIAVVPAPQTANAATATKATAFDWNKNYNSGEIMPYPGVAQTTKFKTNRDIASIGSNCTLFPCNHMVPRIYPTQEEAAKDFGRTFGKWAIRKKLEVGSMIYKFGERQFVMTLARVGEKNSVYSSTGCLILNGYAINNLVLGDAIIHSHGSEGWLDYKEKLSGPDISNAASLSKKVPVPVYVTTPWGSLKRAYGEYAKENYYNGFWFKSFGWLGYKNETVSSDMFHDRTSDGQALKFKHWFGKKCNDCAQK